MTQRIDVCLVAGGLYHDIDFARSELLKLLAEYEAVRVTVDSDYRNTEAIEESQFLISYTCDIRPTSEQQDRVARWIENGGRWLALHGTNAALDATKEGFAAPRCMPTWVHILGSQFIAHPPIQPYRVENARSDHPLVEGIDPFEVDDELYLCEYPDPDALIGLLDTAFRGEAPGFIESDWSASDRHWVMYLRPLGRGAVLYNTLGHCRGHFDMRPLMDYYPKIERGAWERPEYRELLRRGIRWGLGQID